MALLELRSVAQILMNVQIKFVIKALFAKIHPDLSSACAQNKLLVIHILHLVAYYRINVYAMKIALRIWPASKESVPNLVPSLNVDEMLSAKQMIIKLSAYAHRAIWVIQLIKLMDVSASNVSVAMIVAQTNSVIHKLINVKVSNH